jgi:8-hydroxy-5-deazaflavin:NADPH oxidoreductase
MTTWGFIGSGNIGSTVAQLAVNAGDDVVLSNSRGPETLSELVAKLGAKARAATPVEAAEAGDIVVATIPLKNYKELPVAELRGKVVLDTMNYYPQRDGQIAELDNETSTTSELVQQFLPDSKVVKVFNNISFVHLGLLARPSGDPERTALAISGDDAEAKAVVVALLDRIGYDTLDLGPLSEGWRIQRDTAAYGRQYSSDPANWPGAPRRVTREELAILAAAAKRYSDPTFGE